MQAHPLTDVPTASEDGTHPTRGGDAVEAQHERTWTVQCCFAAYSANVVAVEAETAAQACALAIETANASDGWKDLDWCGPTFVEAMAPSVDADPWSLHGSRHPVPDAYTEQGEAPTIVVALADGAVRDARLVGSTTPLRLVVLTAADGTAARRALAQLGPSPRLPAPAPAPTAPDPASASNSPS